jgi:titin
VATPGIQQASIAFTAPASDGGATITNYQYSTDNGTTWKALSPADATTPVVITTRSDAASALANGTTYRVKLRAVNAAGSGTASLAVSVTPRRVSGEPTSLRATPGNAQASIAFTAPVFNGGATITNYEYSTDNGTTWKAFSPADTTTPVVITTRSDAASALVNGTTYQVKLRAVNAAGSGYASTAVSVRPQ